MQVQPLKTWDIENRHVNLFYDQQQITFTIASPYKITTVALERIKNLPPEVLKTEKCSTNTILQLFQKLYPKVVEGEDAAPTLEWIANCYKGMPISVKLSARVISTGTADEVIGLPQETIQLAVNPNDTILEIRDSVRKQADIPATEEVILLYQDQPLKSEATLLSYEICEGATLEHCQEAPKENNKIGFDFNSLQNKKEVEFKSAPDYRTVNRGLNLEGRCTYKGCKAENKWVWIQKGMGTFDIGLEAFTSLCPACRQTAQEVKNAGFWDCVYDIKGFQLKPKHQPVHMPSQIAGKDKLTTFDGSEDLARWSTLTITTKPKI